MKILDVNQAMASKRGDPNYSQISGHVPLDMALEFKISCTKRRVSHSDGLEKAIALWLALPDTATQSNVVSKKEEVQLIQETKSPIHKQPNAYQNLTELIRANYFQLMNAGKINPSRLKDLAFSQKPTTIELAIIANNLEIPKDLVAELSERSFPKNQAKP